MVRAPDPTDMAAEADQMALGSLQHDGRYEWLAGYTAELGTREEAEDD